MTRILVACGVLAALVACGGKSGTLTLTMVVSPGDDPFAQATQARFTVGDAQHVTTVPVSGGHFVYKVSQKPSNQAATIVVEALDAQGNVIAHGRTPPISLVAADQGPVGVWVGRPGRVAPAAAAINVGVVQADGSVQQQPSPRAEMAAASIAGLGILYVGGRDASGNPVKNAAVYDAYLHNVVPVADLPKGIAGASAAPLGNLTAVAYGGATTGGFGVPGAPDGSQLLYFDVTKGSNGVGLWTALPADMIGGRAFASSAVLGSGVFTVTGGLDANGNPLTSAGSVVSGSTIRLAQISTAMAAPRAGHAIAPARFPDGDGALLFGGLASGSTGPVAERLVGQQFSAYDVGALENRVGATATTMPSGDVLILGGKIAGAAVASGVAIRPTTPSGTVTPLPAALSSPREGHTASLTGNDLVVCGGADASGAALASCDILDAQSYALRATVPLANARRGHSSEVLETGYVILAGGLGGDGAPLSSIEVYTP